jgi:hypothetical protein
MKLNRTTALGAVAASALALGLLAVPATAMASTGGTPAATVAGTGPVPVKVRCPPPVLRLAPAPTTVALSILRTRPVPVSGSATIVCCASVPGAMPMPVKPGGKPIVRACSLRPLIFDLAAGASVATEVSGPRLSVHEVVFYRGNIYTVRSAWGDKFTLDFRGRLFVNHGPAVHDGHALAIRGGVFIVVGVPKPCLK